MGYRHKCTTTGKMHTATCAWMHGTPPNLSPCHAQRKMYGGQWHHTLPSTCNTDTIEEENVTRRKHGRNGNSSPGKLRFLALQLFFDRSSRRLFHQLAPVVGKLQLRADLAVDARTPVLDLGNLCNRPRKSMTHPACAQHNGRRSAPDTSLVTEAMEGNGCGQNFGTSGSQLVAGAASCLNKHWTLGTSSQCKHGHHAAFTPTTHTTTRISFVFTLQQTHTHIQ